MDDNRQNYRFHWISVAHLGNAGMGSKSYYAISKSLRGKQKRSYGPGIYKTKKRAGYKKRDLNVFKSKTSLKARMINRIVLV